jgi:PAS domain S-box-containing protein
MDGSMNLLHLEDDPADAELVQATLEEAGLSYRIHCVQTRDAFESALVQGGINLIIADYRLPAFDGISALWLTQELSPDIPFIFVSGTMGEEAAIAALTQGATDYVLKHNLARLPSAVQRALEEARNRHERKKAEEQVDLLSFAINSIHEAVFLIDENARFAYVNDEACRLLGYSREQLLTMGPSDVDSDISMEEWPDLWHRLKASRSLTYDGNLQTREGRIVPVEINANHFVYKGQSYNLGLARDISERQRAELERLSNLKFFESMDRINRAIQSADNIQDMMKDLLDIVLSIFDCDRSFLMYPCDPESSTWRVPVERSKTEYQGAGDSNQEIPMDPQVAETLRVLLAADGPVCFGPDTPHELPRDASAKFGFKSFMSMAIHPRTGGPWQFGVHQCDHQRLWTEEEMRLFEAIGRRLADSLSSMQSLRDLRESERFLDSVVEHIPNMIFVKDAQTLRFVKFNQAGEQLVGYSREELLGKTDHDFFPKEEADFFTAKDRRVLESKEPVDIPEEIIHNRSNEERILHTKKLPILDDGGTPQYLLGISEDITDRKALEAQFRQVQKMEAIGQLAGGIAHDFNNILSAITGFTEISLSAIEPSSPVGEYLDQVMEACQRAKELINQILMFSREADKELKPIQVSLPVKEALKLIRASLPATIEVRFRYDSQASALADPTQIHQIVMNLCTNAAHAMRDNGGRLDVRLTDITIDRALIRKNYPDAKPGNYIRLLVSDEGYGIAPHHLHRIFDPFFTTKQKGEGTGMGLSVVHGIIKSYGGSIYVHSRLEEGCTIEILIPALERAKTSAPVSDTPIPTGSESILFVDDETMIVQIVKKMLKALGYRVTARTSAIEALEAFKNNPDGFDLVVTDMMMPKMSGLDLAEKIMEIKPDLPIVLCSGFSIKINEDAVVRRSVRDFIYKPILRREIATVVRKVLDQC